MNTRRLTVAGWEVQVRPIHGQDEVEACARLMATSEPWRTLGRGYAAGVRLLQQPDREVYVAVDDGEVLGFLILCLTGGFVGYLQTIGVREDWRSRGLGRALLSFAEDRIFAEHPNVFICVSSFNPRARSLYERQGYETIGVIRDFVVTGHDEVLMRKTRGPLASPDRTDGPVPA